MRINVPAKVRRELGLRIAALRRSRGWTQEDLAEKVGVSTRYLQSVEGGHENLTIDSMAKLGNALRVHVTELFAPGPPGTEKPEPTARGESGWPEGGQARPAATGVRRTPAARGRGPAKARGRVPRG